MNRRKTSMIIRAASDADRQAIATIHAASWRASYAEVIASEFLANVEERMVARWAGAEISTQDVLLLAENDGPEGFIFVRDAEPAFINVLHVMPGLRSQGVGAALMAEAARRLHSHGRAAAYLDVLTTNTRAIAFYQRLGGIAGQIKHKEVGGMMLPNLRIDFPDLAAIIEAA